MLPKSSVPIPYDLEEGSWGSSWLDLHFLLKRAQSWKHFIGNTLLWWAFSSQNWSKAPQNRALHWSALPSPTCRQMVLWGLSLQLTHLDSGWHHFLKEQFVTFPGKAPASRVWALPYHYCSCCHVGNGVSFVEGFPGLLNSQLESKPPANPDISSWVSASFNHCRVNDCTF